jgi:hypothetical protein
MEMIGVGLFLSALIAVLADQTGHVRIIAGPPPAAEDAAADEDAPAENRAVPAVGSDPPGMPDTPDSLA